MTHHWGYMTDDEGRGQSDERAMLYPDDDATAECSACGRPLKGGGFMDDSMNGECRACMLKRQAAERRAELSDEAFRREQMHRDTVPDKNVQEDSEGFAW